MCTGTLWFLSIRRGGPCVQNGGEITILSPLSPNHHLKGRLRTPRRWHRTRHRRLTPSPGSRTGSDALVEASSWWRRRSPAASAGTATRARALALAACGRRRSLEPLGSPCTRGRAPAFRVRCACGRVGVWDRSNRVLLYRLPTNEFFCYFKIIDGVETSYPLVLNDPLATTPKETRLRATHRPKATHAERVHLLPPLVSN